MEIWKLFKQQYTTQRLRFMSVLSRWPIFFKCLFIFLLVFVATYFLPEKATGILISITAVYVYLMKEMLSQSKMQGEPIIRAMIREVSPPPAENIHQPNSPTLLFPYLGVDIINVEKNTALDVPIFFKSKKAGDTDYKLLKTKHLDYVIFNKSTHYDLPLSAKKDTFYDYKKLISAYKKLAGDYLLHIEWSGRELFPRYMLDLPIILEVREDSLVAIKLKPIYHQIQKVQKGVQEQNK